MVCCLVFDRFPRSFYFLCYWLRAIWCSILFFKGLFYLVGGVNLEEVINFYFLPVFGFSCICDIVLESLAMSSTFDFDSLCSNYESEVFCWISNIEKGIYADKCTDDEKFLLQMELFDVLKMIINYRPKPFEDVFLAKGRMLSFTIMLRGYVRRIREKTNCSICTTVCETCSLFD